MAYTADTIRRQVRQLTDETYDVDAIVDTIVQRYGLVNVDAIDPDEFWALVEKHHDADAEEAADATRYEAERARGIEIAHHAMTRTYIGPPPKLRGDAERMIDALILVGWTPPAPSRAVEVEEYDEWRLTGQPEGDRPFSSTTGRAPEEIRLLKLIWSAIESGHPNYRWTNAALTRRHVRVERSEWVVAEPERGVS